MNLACKVLLLTGLVAHSQAFFPFRTTKSYHKKEDKGFLQAEKSLLTVGILT